LKKAKEVMEILEAYDLTGSLRGAAALCGCDHKTVREWVRARDAAGGEPRPAGRARPVTGAFLEKGGAPTYALTDNEKTVSTDHVCGIAVRNPRIVEASRHYGLTIATCVPADPESKGLTSHCTYSVSFVGA
jgi:hypothetical protein